MTVIGARPQIINAAAISRAEAAFNACGVEQLIGKEIAETNIFGDGHAAERIVKILETLS